MRKSILVLYLLCSAFLNCRAQQIELGVFGGYAFHNIVNTKITEGKAVIGDPIWDINKGVSIGYYFKNDKGAKLTAFYSNINKGSQSERYATSKFEYNTNMLGLLIGYGGNIGNNFSLYADIGLGYTMLRTDKPYKGTEDEVEAFPLLEEELIMKSSEVNFIFDLGTEYKIASYFKIFFEMYTDPAIYRFNESKGKYQNQGIGFNLGLKYFVNFKRNHESTE